MDVVFEVASQSYPLDEQAAMLMAENLRVKAAHEPGAEGASGARAVADAIELRLIEDTTDPVNLGGDGAEAVFYAPRLPTGGSSRLWKPASSSRTSSSASLRSVLTRSAGARGVAPAHVGT